MSTDNEEVLPPPRDKRRVIVDPAFTQDRRGASSSEKTPGDGYNALGRVLMWMWVAFGIVAAVVMFCGAAWQSFGR